MSKIGKLPVQIPKGVKVDLKDGNQIDINGPKGNLSRRLHKDMKINIDSETITVERPTDSRNHKALHGLTRTLIYNMVTGVSDGYSKTLELVGVGYRAEMKGKLLEMHLGLSHPVLVGPPESVEISVIPKENKIIVSGPDKQLVGQTAAEIRKFRPPEPYKGKGIKYSDEQIRRKAGKAAGK